MNYKLLIVFLVISFLLSGTALAVSDALAAPEAPLATSDAYGYTVTSGTIGTSWIDASGGTVITFPVFTNSVATTPVSLGFTFLYYEKSYTNVYVGTNGVLIFSNSLPDGTSTSLVSRIPRSQPPNNILAPYWDILSIGGPQVTYLTGGAEPNRYAVFQYTAVQRLGIPDSSLTFQVILHENGNFEFLYQTLTEPGTNYAVGIEDSDGLDGIQYYYKQAGLASNLALRFVRPLPSRRIKALSLEESSLLTLNAGNVNLVFRNTGNLGTDIFQFPDIAMGSGWTYSLLNGVTRVPLTDTDSNGVRDSGPVAEGADFIVTVSIRNSNNLTPGTYTRFTFTAQSKNDTSKIATTQVQFAVPPAFAFAYSDNDNTEAMALGLLSAYSRKETTFDLTYSGASIGINQVANDNLLVFWEGENRYFSYTILDRFGNQFSPINTINDGNPITDEVYPIFAAAPNGRIGLVYLYRDASIPQITNVYFKILDANGAPVTGFTTPKNLTGSTSATNAFYNPSIVATTNNRFVIAWTGDDSTTSNIYIAVYDAASGLLVKGPTAMTSATSDLFFDAGTLAALSNSHVLLAYTAISISGNSHQIAWVGLDANGNELAGTRKTMAGSVSTTSGEVFLKDAIELSEGGNVLLAWLDEAGESIKAVAVNPSLATSSAIVTLGTPNLREAKDLSVTKSQEGYGVVHWMDATIGQYLYYALLDGNGNVLTPPMTLLKMTKSENLFYASSTAQGLAPLDSFFTLNLPTLMNRYNPGTMIEAAAEEETWQP